jgi:hypothetical protein
VSGLHADALRLCPHLLLQMNEEAQRLANHAFGAPLLHVMGYMYDRKAEPWLGNIVGEWFARKYHNAVSIVSALQC